MGLVTDGQKPISFLKILCLDHYIQRTKSENILCNKGGT